MSFSSTVKILLVENEPRMSRAGSEYQHFAARSILLGDDDKTVVTVGALRVRDEALQAQCFPGLFRASFGFMVPDYGDDAGDIVSTLTALTPVTAGAAPVAAVSTVSHTVQILTVENEKRTSSKNKPYTHFAARSILLADDGKTVMSVGAIRTRNPALQKQCAPGFFRASFALQVPDFGNDKGNIVAVLTGLTPFDPARTMSRAPVASTPAPGAAGA